MMTTQTTEALDLDMLAADLAKMLDRYGYDIDATADDIRPTLPAFIAQIQANAAAISDEPGEDAATWTPETEPTPEPVRLSAPKLGRVRLVPIWRFAVTGPNQPVADECEIWISDYDKQGETWARQQAEHRTAEDGGTLGRMVGKDTLRWRPWAK